MNSPILSVLIHTFNKYEHLWKGCADSFVQHWDETDIKIYFGTDIPGGETLAFPGSAEVIYSGPGEWSDRLRKLVSQIDTPYILYIQEDHWLTQSPPDLGQLMYQMRQLDLYRLQLSPITRFYTLEGTDPLYFSLGSKYLVSHQPSIWKKSFLLECLEPGETPWVNEYEGTKRLERRNDVEKKIAIYPCDWYKHMCIKGKMVES